VLAYRLSQRGARVTLLERAPFVGGVAQRMDFGGHSVDRFYHVVLPSDQHMIQLATEVGVEHDLRFTRTEVGFYADGRLVPLNGIGDLLRFPPLDPLQRLRLGWFVAQCQLRSGYRRLDEIPLETWLNRHCGRGVVERIWKPLLASRFDGSFAELPATYLWARTRRMKSARKGGGAESMGAFDGGHQRLIDALTDAARAQGAEIECGVPVEGLELDDAGAAVGVRVAGETRAFDLTIATLQPPALTGFLPEQLQPLLDRYPRRYLGVVCLVLKVRRSVLPYYSVNICASTPITTVVETSHVVGTDHTDGLRLLYLPKYCERDAPEHREDPESIFARFTSYLAELAPSFSKNDVVDWTVQRAPIVEPVHGLGAGARIAPLWPSVNGLVLASNAQIYPNLLSGDSVSSFADHVAAQVADRLGLRTQTAA
jgi:protoporphyrinogen oxidase